MPDRKFPRQKGRGGSKQLDLATQVGAMACALPRIPERLPSIEQNCYPHVMAKETQNSNRLRKYTRRGAIMNGASRICNWLGRTFTWFVSGKIVLAFIVIAVSAASIVVTPTTYQAEVGGELNVTNRLVAVDKGFPSLVPARPLQGHLAVAQPYLELAPLQTTRSQPSTLSTMLQYTKLSP